MAKMTMKRIEACYDAAIYVSEDRITISKATETVAKETELNAASAKMYISAVLAMLNGRAFGMNINEESIDYFLQRIKKDYGNEAQRRAAEAVLTKFLKDQHGNKYLKCAMTVMNKREVEKFIDSYKEKSDIWPLGR